MLDVKEGVKGWGACPNSAAGISPSVEFRPDRFRHLSPDGQHLITQWAKKAAEEAETPFEAFIYAWISFNGWASCCCGTDRDRTLIDALRIDDRVSAEFNSLASDPTLALARDNFRSLWPIFRASHVRGDDETAVSAYRYGGRAALVEYYIHEFESAERAPDCHRRHGQETDSDWGHTLEALYRVRNNLFHGRKSVLGDADREVVDAAAAVLVPVVNHLVSDPFRWT